MKEFFKGLSWVQLVAGAGAAVTSFLLSAHIGISGSLIGAAVASVVSATASQVYKNVLNTSTKKLKQGMGLADEETQAAKPTDAASAPRVQADARASQHVGWWEREQGVAGQTRVAPGADATTPADGTATQWDAATVRMQAQTQAQAARGAHAQREPLLSDEPPVWGVPQATDEQDARAALSSFDAPVGDEGLAGAGAGAGSAQVARTQAYGGVPAQGTPDRTMRMPAGHAGVNASAYSRDAYANRVHGGAASTRETRAAAGAYASPARPASIDGTRTSRRGQVLGVAVAILSGLAAVIVCAVVISVLTSGKGLGYKPTSSWLPSAPATSTSTSTKADAANKADVAKSAVADALGNLVQGAADAASGAMSAASDAVSNAVSGAGAGSTTTTGGATSTGTPAATDTPAAGTGTTAGGTDTGAGTGTGATAGETSGGATESGAGAGAGETTTTGGAGDADAGTDAAGTGTATDAEAQAAGDATEAQAA